MANCPWCEDVEAPPGSCPLHQGQPREPRMRPCPKPQEVHLRRANAAKVWDAAKHEAYKNGLKDGVILTLFVIFVIMTVWMILVVQ